MGIKAGSRKYSRTVRHLHRKQIVEKEARPVENFESQQQAVSPVAGKWRVILHSNGWYAAPRSNESILREMVKASGSDTCLRFNSRCLRTECKGWKRARKLYIAGIMIIRKWRYTPMRKVLTGWAKPETISNLLWKMWCNMKATAMKTVLKNP